jgi:hypothetical protein
MRGLFVLVTLTMVGGATGAAAEDSAAVIAALKDGPAECRYLATLCTRAMAGVEAAAQAQRELDAVMARSNAELAEIAHGQRSVTAPSAVSPADIELATRVSRQLTAQAAVWFGEWQAALRVVEAKHKRPPACTRCPPDPISDRRSSGRGAPAPHATPR